jgi:Na+-translocating ferredoxin:NAD+ oxidoreductase RnfG subunit
MRKVFCILLLVAAVSVFAAEKENQEVKKVIRENIKLLEADDIKSALTNLIHPEEAKGRFKITDDFIERFKKRKKDQLLAAFKEAENINPFYSSETMVSYKLERRQKADFLTFKLYKGKWFLSKENRNPVKKK